MIDISLCMIVKNEEEVIGNCLGSVAEIVDEIIIVDTGSSDKTKEIAKGYTDNVYDLPWSDDFSEARNFSFSKASKKYILWLDADDILLEEDRNKLKELKEDFNEDIDVVMMTYNYAFDEAGNVILSHFRERLVKREKAFVWVEPVHEYLATTGVYLNSDIVITHNKKNEVASGRNIKIYEKNIANGVELSSRGIYYYGRELFHSSRYEEAIGLFEKFIECSDVWNDDRISCCYDLAICYAEIGNNKSRLQTLLRSFEFDVPRAEICCQLGYYFKDINIIDRAIYWFDMASKIKKNSNAWGFVLHDCYDYVPYIELCVCYEMMGNLGQAIKNNLLAAKYKPYSEEVLYNKEYFENASEESRKIQSELEKLLENLVIK